MIRLDLSEIYTMMEYFYFTKGDIERWCDWNKAMKILQEKDPDIIVEYNKMILAKESFELMLKDRYNK